MPPLITPDEALATILDATPVLAPKLVPADDAIGRVLAQDVAADQDYPPFDRAMMDGYAVRVADEGRAVPVAGEVAAGRSFDRDLPADTAVAIMTGAPCPPGTEAVVQKEHVDVRDGMVQLPDNIEPDRNIVRAGSECRRGEVVVRAGTAAMPLHRALMATFGLVDVSVYPRAVARVIATGSELTKETATPAQSQIRSSNAPMLNAFLACSGAECDGCDTVTDNDRDLIDAFESARYAHTVISTGGISAGNYDRVPAALESMGAEIVFRGVEQRPGKPMLFARVKDSGPLIFGLSGNPMACLVGFNVYVLPALRKMMGFDPPVTCRGRLVERLQGRGKFTWFATGVARPADDGWQLTPLTGRGAADMFTTANANALIHVPPGAGLAPGDAATFQVLPGAAFSK